MRRNGISAVFRTDFYQRRDGVIIRRDYPFSLKHRVKISHTRQGGGLRGKITGFSRQSRERMINLVSRCEPDGAVFVTLTLGRKIVTVKEAKRFLRAWHKRMQRKSKGDFGYVWKFEYQRRGQPHFHLLVWGDWEPQEGREAWVQLVKDTHTNTEDLRNFSYSAEPLTSDQGATCYATKYMGKPSSGGDCCGRIWGREGKLPLVPDKFLGTFPTHAVSQATYEICSGVLKEFVDKVTGEVVEMDDPVYYRKYYYGDEAVDIKEFIDEVYWRRQNCSSSIQG